MHEYAFIQWIRGRSIHFPLWSSPTNSRTDLSLSNGNRRRIVIWNVSPNGYIAAGNTHRRYQSPLEAWPPTGRLSRADPSCRVRYLRKHWLSDTGHLLSVWREDNSRTCSVVTRSAFMRGHCCLPAGRPAGRPACLVVSGQWSVTVDSVFTL